MTVSGAPIHRAQTMPPRADGPSVTTSLPETRNNTEAVILASNQMRIHAAKDDLYSYPNVRGALAALINLCFVYFVFVASLLAGVLPYAGFPLDYILYAVPPTSYMLYLLINFMLFLRDVGGWIDAYRRKPRLREQQR